MIIDFSIKNFGSIKDTQTLSFEAEKSNQLEDYYIIKVGKYRLLKMALIYGPNASGKTTVLNALDFLRKLVNDPLEKKTDTLDFEPYLFDVKTPKQNTFLSINFLQKKVRYHYQVEFNKKCVVKESLDFYNPNKANVYTRTSDTQKQLTEITWGSKIKADKSFEKVLEANTLWNNTVLGGSLKTNIDINEIKDATDFFGGHLNNMIRPKTDLSIYVGNKISSNEIDRNFLTNILKKADFNIDKIILEEKEKTISEIILYSLTKGWDADNFYNPLKDDKEFILPELSFQHSLNNKLYTLPFRSESNGTQRYFGLAGILTFLINKSKIIPIDELESSLHPDLYIHFLLSFMVNAKSSQIIATTHNREILNNKELFRDDAIWFTDKAATGATELYSLADFDSSVIRDTSNVYNAYKAGKLGAVPNLGDYYIDLEK